MEQWLSRHAIKNIWQRPTVPGDLTFAPKHLTPEGEVRSFVLDGSQVIDLPNESWFNVYHIGKFHRNFGNLRLPLNRWVKLGAVVNELSCFMVAYNEDGHTIPSNYCWLRRLPNGAVLLAVKWIQRYDWVNHQPLWFRIYPGNYPNDSKQSLHPTRILHYEISNVAKRQKAIEDFRRLENEKKGWVSCWVNGKFVDNPTTDDVLIWDDFEIRIDGLVDFTYDFSCKGLPTFNSELDSTRKFLLHLPKKMRDWYFSRNCEIIVLHKRDGRYYQRHMNKYLRNITPSDFSLPSERINHYRLHFNEQVKDINDLTIRLVVRKSYLPTKPIFNATHDHDLYKLTDKQIIEAMVGANSNVPEWKASNLEKSSYMLVSGAKDENITRELCTGAYGYNAISRYFADTPTKLTLDSRGWGCELTPLLAKQSVIYEYDQNGIMLDVFEINDTPYYYARNPRARLIEAIVGSSCDCLNITDNAPDFEIEEGDNVSLYLRLLSNEIPTDNYEPAVEGVDYEREGRKVKWKVDRTRRHPTVIHDDKHLFYSIDVDTYKQGEIRIPILVRNQSGEERTQFLPMETTEVWLNGYPLVQSIDYTVIWPEIVVANKVYIPDGGKVRLAVRCRGVTGEMRVPKHGFITAGMLSDNTTFDVRDDKVVRIVAAGGLRHRDDVEFREDATMALTNNVIDGFPYSVDDPTIPLRRIPSVDTYTLRDISRDLDSRVEDYLTPKIPTPHFENPNPLSNWYHLFSPTLNIIMHHYQISALTLVEDDPEFKISTTQLVTIMKRYESYLPFDPAYTGYDHRYVRVHPHMYYHVVEIDELLYAFLDRVNARYLEGRVQLNQYLKIRG